VDPDRYPRDKCRLCQLEPETSSHVIADCMALDYNRLATMKTTHLVTPYTWHLHPLRKFLDLIADRLEDTDAPPRPLTLFARIGTRTMLLDETSFPSDPPPSP